MHHWLKYKGLITLAQIIKLDNNIIVFLNITQL